LAHITFIKFLKIINEKYIKDDIMSLETWIKKYVNQPTQIGHLARYYCDHLHQFKSHSPTPQDITIYRLFKIIKPPKEMWDLYREVRHEYMTVWRYKNQQG
jgi:hypothetical protein